jgi:hypothetical protein
MASPFDLSNLPKFWALVDDIQSNTVALAQISIMEYSPTDGKIISAETSILWMDENEEEAYKTIATTELPKRSNLDSFKIAKKEDDPLSAPLFEFVHFKRIKPKPDTHFVVSFMYDGETAREPDLEGMGYAKAALQLALLDDLLEIKRGGRRAKKSAGKARSTAKLAISKSELILLREALESVVSKDDYQIGGNALPVPLTRNQFMGLVRTVEAAISFHDIPAWDKRTKKVIRALFGVLVELERLGPQVHKTFSAWVPIRKLMKSVIKRLRAALDALSPD